MTSTRTGKIYSVLITVIPPAVNAQADNRGKQRRYNGIGHKTGHMQGVEGGPQGNQCRGQQRNTSRIQNEKGNHAQG